MKKCSKCGEVKPYDAFCKRAKSIDGLQAYCKPCAKLYAADNPEKMKNRGKKYYAANRKKINARRRAHRAANNEKVNAQNRAYRAANYERLNDWRKAYKAANIEKIKGQNRACKRNAIDTLDDNYIKSILTKNTALRAADIPDWLIEAKREQLRLKRELRK